MIENNTTIKNLKTQIGQLVTIVERLEAKPFVELPFQIDAKPREIVNDIIIESCKQLEESHKASNNYLSKEGI